MNKVPLSKKEIEEALEDRSGLLWGLIENMPYGFFFKDKGGQYLAANSTMAKIFDLDSPTSAVGKKTADLFPHDTATTIEADDRAVMSSGQACESADKEVVMQDGRRVWLTFQRIPLQDKKGETIGLACFVHDVTSGKKLEQDLRNANMRLSSTLAELKQAHQRIIQGERLNALGEMASGIAHDFNNALMPILGYSDVLIAKPEILNQREEALVMLKDIRTAAMDASQAVRRLREFYRAASDEEEAVGDLNQQVKTAVVLTRPKWDAEMRAKGINITVDTELAQVAMVNAKESQLREVLINLFLNAIDAMPVGGHLFIKTTNEKDRVVLQVSDTGTGMSEDVRRRCVEPFFTTKGEGGTGLGLSLTYGFVQRHKGTLDIETTLNKGTTVTIRLPVHKPGAEQKAQPAATPFGAKIPRLRILVVDDEPSARKLMERFLSSDGHSVEIATNGREGIETLRKDKFDLVVLDRAMPDMSGDQVAAAIHQVNPGMPVIMVTGFGDIMNDDGQCPIGVNLVLSKPLTQGTLREGMMKLVRAGILTV